MKARYAIALSGIAAVAVFQARPTFEPVQPELFALGTSLVNAFADYDGDGDLDLFVGFNGVANRLYQNDNGVYSDVAARAGVADARATRAAAWSDYDADGDPDLLLGFAPGAAGPVLRVMSNNKGSFTDVTAATGITATTGAVRQLAWIDFDGDQDLDLFVAFRDRANALWLNDGGKFADVAEARGVADKRRSVGAVWFDIEQDGDLDLVVGNMDGDPNSIFINDKGTFTSRADSALMWGGRTPRDSTSGTVRPCAADVNNDGRVDLFFANYGRNGLFLNRGNGRFEDVSAAWGITQEGKYDACAFADFDNDGMLDLYVNGTVTGGVSYRDYLYRNTGTTYEDVTPPNVQALQADHGVYWADVDRDGDVDLALTGTRADGMHSLLRNTLTASANAQSISVRVVDRNGRATRAGAEVHVYDAANGKHLGTGLVDAGSGYNTQSDMPVHVGVGSAKSVNVHVVWPATSRAALITKADVAQYKGKDLVVQVRIQ